MLKVTPRFALVAFVILLAAAAAPSAHPASLDAKLTKSTNVLRFFENHSWLQAPRRDRCVQVPWTGSCLIARERIRFHTRRIGELEAQLPAGVAICRVFGAYCEQALAVTHCESGRRTWASNGQYLGMFQMGDYARARFGHSNTAIGQARAAWRYFDESGRDWSPWSCKPWR